VFVEQRRQSAVIQVLQTVDRRMLKLR